MRRPFIYAILILISLSLSSRVVPQQLPDIVQVSRPSTSLAALQVPRTALFVSVAQLTPITPPPAPASSVSATIAGCGDSYYANLVYTKESHCSLTAVNPHSGDYGIGQSGSGLSNACPDWQTDYTCQNNFFTAYATTRYGGWEQAYQAWLAQGWW